MVGSAELYSLGFGLILVGVVLLFVAAIAASARRSGGGKTKTAGIIVVGPVPIIFGSDKKSVKTILALSISLTVFLVVAMLVYYFLFRMR